MNVLLPIVGITRAYSFGKAKRDLIAGLTVALFTIPQSMAYALIAGFPPAAGIATAVVASIAGAVFGSSEFLINGPTNAICVMIASNAAILASNGDPKQAVIVMTLMIGVMQCVGALFKVGAFTRFVSEPVLTGFTAGAGIYIAVNQLPSALGIEKAGLVRDFGGWEPMHNAVFDLLRTLLSLSQAQGTTFGVALGTFALVRLIQWADTRWLKRRLVAPIIVVATVTLVAYLLHLGDSSRGGEKIKLVRDIEPIARSFPSFVFPTLDWTQVKSLISPMIAIGILGAVEAIAIGKSLANRAGHAFSANKQLVGEGACNVAASLVGGFASSGSFSRTAVNFEAGAVTRYSCIFSGLLVMVIVLLFAPAANYIPIAVLSGMLIHIGLKLVNAAKIKLISKSTIGDRRALLLTFVAVLISPDLEYALFAGIAISLFQALRRAEGFKLALLEEDENGHLIETPTEGRMLGKVATFDLQGELFFAAAEELENQLRSLFDGNTRFVVLRLQQAYNMDLTCTEAIAFAGQHARSLGGRLILSGVRPGMYGTLERSGAIDLLGSEAVFRHEPTLLGSTKKAIDFAEQLAAMKTTASA